MAPKLKPAHTLTPGDTIPAVHIPTDGRTTYTPDITTVTVDSIDECGNHFLEMRDDNGNIVTTRDIASHRVEANLEENNGAFGILVPEE